MTDPYAETDTWPDPPASQQPARPATLAASGPSRVAGEGSDAQEAREAAFAEAIMGGAERAAILTVRNPGEVANAYRDARAVMAVADAELAVAWDLAREARSDVENHRVGRERMRLQRDYTRLQRDEALARADAAERARDAALAEVTELRDRLGRVEALRDRWLAVDVPSAEVTSWSHYAGAALRAALAVPTTGDTEDASPAAEDALDPCGRKVGSKTWWMSSDQYDPCRCLLPKGHDGECKCSHTLEDAGAASPTEQATEGGAK